MSAFVLPHELHKRIALDNGRLLLDEKPTTWYQSAPVTAKSKLVISRPEPPCLITGVGFCILGHHDSLRGIIRWENGESARVE